MYEEVVEKILKSIDESLIAASYPKFSGEGYRAHKIDAKNFHEINKKVPSKRIAFVDGGSAEILGSANFSLNLIRVSYAIYQGGGKIISKKFEILAFIRSVSLGNEIHYSASFFKTSESLDMQDISFSSFDYTLMMGANRAEITGVANAVRRFSELKLAKIISDGRLADIIVLDGNLQSTLTNENNYLNELYASCSANNVILSAISKTNSLFTDNGNLLSVVLGDISKLPSWIYHPVADISNVSHKAEMFFVKLHDKSKYIFRFEIFNAQKERAEETISAIAGNCIDPIFIGYPYGLVEADRLARVSNREKESLRMMFLVKLKGKGIEKFLNAGNAHQILDRINF